MSTDEARRTFKEWEECQELLARKTRVLREGMDDYLAGTSPMPADLVDEVLRLQRKCMELFGDVVKAMNAP